MPKLNVVACDDWKLVCACNWYGVVTDLPKALADCLLQVCWTIQDGYGTPGIEVPQGWDWSGIRDSSDNAKANMAKAIRAILVYLRIPVIGVAACPGYSFSVDPEPFKD